MTVSHRGQPLHYKTVFETRTFFSFRVREEALQAVLPQGWTAASSQEGPDQGSNVRFGMSDQFAGVDPAGAPVEATRFCPLTVSARKSGQSSPEVYRIAIAYWSNAHFSEPMRRSAIAVAGAGATRTPDVVELEREIRVDRAGEAVGRQRWLFKSPSQEVSAELSWSMAEQVQGKEQFWVMSPAAGEAFREYHIEKVEETVFSGALGINRSRSVNFRAAGPVLTPLFDGSEILVSIVVQPFGRRDIYLY